MVVRAAIIAYALVASLGGAYAQSGDYPNKPIRIIVPFAPGAGNDLLGRLTAENLTPRIGQTVYVENKPGAGSLIGVDLVAKAPADGYTLLWAASDGLSILPAIKAKMPYTVPNDFSFITRMAELPFAIVVSNNLPVNTMAEMLAYAKANPGQLRYGTSGIGGGPHMGSLLIEKVAGVQMTHVAYRGVGPAVNDLLGGHIDMALVTPPTIKAHADDKKVKVIATTGTTRHPLFPDVPTLTELGMKDATVVIWYGIMAPAGLPAPVLARLSKEIGEVVKDPAVNKRLDTLGYQISPLPGDGFKDFVMKDMEKWKELAKSANIVLED